MTVSVVIPAHNEADTIGAVLSAVAASRSAARVVVIADACIDATARVAHDAGAQVLEIDAADKGTAMAVGLAQVATDDVLFIDADVAGLAPGHVAVLATLPPRDGMVVGLRASAVAGSGLPPISGERRLPTAFARSVSLAGMGYRAELAIDAAVARAGLPHRHVRLLGVGNPSRPWRHPLMWADLATFAVLHAPALVDYLAQG